MSDKQPDLTMYAGRWTAIVRGRVVATAESAHQALLHCRQARIKDEPVLRFVPVRQDPELK
jgi:hypothetical protein